MMKVLTFYVSQTVYREDMTKFSTFNSLHYPHVDLVQTFLWLNDHFWRNFSTVSNAALNVSIEMSMVRITTNRAYVVFHWSFAHFA